MRVPARSLTSPGLRHPGRLDGAKVLEARFDGGVLMVVSARDGGYHRHVFRFDRSCERYDVRTVTDVVPGGLNFVTLDSGVCVCLNEDDGLEVSSRRPGDSKIKLVTDDLLGGDMRLVPSAGASPSCATRAWSR